MSSKFQFQNYEDLFSLLALSEEKKVSVYSPSAYLVDLLQLLDDKIPEYAEELDRRRDDIKENIKLNIENTYTLVSYLDIVNRILEEKISGSTAVKSAKYPLNLPFNFENEKIKKFLSYLETSSEDIYKIFDLKKNRHAFNETVAREYLKLSQEEYEIFIEPSELTDDSYFAEYWGIRSGELLKSVPQFLAITGVSAKELIEILYQKLNQIENEEAYNFFINKSLEAKGYVKLDETGKNLLWQTIDQSIQTADIPLEWFKRTNLSIRLARKIAISFADLDLILRCCCNNTLDKRSIQIIATVKKNHDKHQLPIDVICSFFNNINILGIGDDNEPQDLFNRIFNSRFAGIDKKYISVPELKFIPSSYSNYVPLTCLGDILSLDNNEYRQRICRALYISEQELILIVERFRAWSDNTSKISLLDTEQPIGLSALSLLFRISKLSEVLDISCLELLNILDILSQDISLHHNIHNFKVLLDYPTQKQDCYEIITCKNIEDSLWLVQLLFAVVQWMQSNDFNSQELQFLLIGKETYKQVEAVKKYQKIEHFNTLYQQFKPFLFSSELLESDNFDSRFASILYDRIADEEHGLVSQYNSGILTGDFSLAKTAFYDALIQLDVIIPEDFAMLGFGSKILDKIFRNLIIHRYINTEGYFNEEKLALVDRFTIETDFCSLKTSLFRLIQDLLVDEIEFTKSNNKLDDDQYNDEFEEVYAESKEYFYIYLSDLDSLEKLTEPERQELYDNLIFNGYIDESGKVLQADFFSFDDNVDKFKINVDLIDASAKIFDTIDKQTAQFVKKKLVLNKSIFTHLKLKEFEIDDLINNLRFNDYLNENGAIQDKEKLLDLDVKDFNLALVFYPHRHKILAAIKEFITEFKSKFYTLSRETFAQNAEYIAGRWIYKDLVSQYQVKSQQSALDEIASVEHDTFFLESEQLHQLSLRPYFSADDTELIANTIEDIINRSHKYRFTTNLLEELYLEETIQDELFTILQNNSFLLEKGIIPKHKLDYFLNINNALIFNLDEGKENQKFADYNKDIFFILHAIAKEIDNSLNEVVFTLQDLAQKQEDILFLSLQGVFSINADTIKVLCQNIFHSPNNSIVEEFLIPILSIVDGQGKIMIEPNSNKFNIAYKRIEQFSLLVSKLGLSAAETAIIFKDQDLVEKFPENLILPEQIDSIDALIESPEGITYLFKDKQRWAYSAETYNLLDRETLLTRLKEAGYSEDYANKIAKDPTIDSFSEKFADLDKIDAAFVDRNGKAYIVARDKLYIKEQGKERWIEQEKEWGKIDDNFAEPERIDAAFQDKDGKTYLFVGDQYVRYSDLSYEYVDRGHPLKIAGNWQGENFDRKLPDEFEISIDAAFQDTNDKKYLFKGDRFICSDNLDREILINEMWGKIKNNFASAQSIDAAYVDGSRLIVLLGDRLIAYQNSIENDYVTVEEGYPTLLESYYQNIPAEFVSGIDTAFKTTDGRMYLFKKDLVVEFEPGNTVTIINNPQNTKSIFGKVRNNILDNGMIDAAFVGLDGKTYLFSGEQYFRYSGEDYSQVDEGFPRTIKDDWGGLQAVDAVFILDGKTYLFGKVAAEGEEPLEDDLVSRSTNTEGEAEQLENNLQYVRYSTNDYTEPDKDYPKVPNDNWWNLPFELVEEGAIFNEIDAVFNAKDGKTYLFSGEHFIYYDRQQRWWSEPAFLKDYWDSIPFDSVNAAFTGTDGKTYLFSGEEFVRYSGIRYNQLDDRYPNITDRYWGKVVNNIEKTGKVDAVFAVESLDEPEPPVTYTYLFSGNQYFRYTDMRQGFEYIDEGYPKYIATSLKKEPRFKHLDFDCDDGIDAAFSDRRNVYIFKNSQLQVISSELSATYSYGDLELDLVSCAWIDKQGNLFIEGNQWDRLSSLEGQEVQQTPLLPTILRQVPPQYQSGLSAILTGVDGNTYLFKNHSCFNVSLNKEYPLAEEWGRVNNNIKNNSSIDAAFVGRNGKTYLFSGDQYVVYEEGEGSYTDAHIEGHPQSIAADWGGLTNVHLAFIEEGKTYLFAKPDADGNMLSVCYSTADYSQPDAGFPKTTNLAFLEVQQNYIADGFTQIEAVLFEDDNMFLLNREEYIQFNKKDEQWTHPKPLDRIWRGFRDLDDDFRGVKTAFTGRDGVTYFFSDEYYVAYQDGQVLGSPSMIADDWGIVDNNFTNEDSDYKVDAAFVFQDKITYLFSGDQYVRYSTEDYRFVDEGYPKSIAENLLAEECFKNAPDTLAEAIDRQLENLEHSSSKAVIDAIASNHHNLYIFIANKCLVVSQSLTRNYDLDIIGKVKNNFVEYNHIDAALVNREEGQTFLFSGDQYVRYSDDSYEYVDDGYPKAISSLVDEAKFPNLEDEAKSKIAAFIQHGIDAAIGDAENENIYLFKNKQYLSFQDPDAIASFRYIAYQKAIVMAYIDNLLDWGDMLFRQYTHESINEARMLYILAYDLLGKRPEYIVRRSLPEALNYDDLKALNIGEATQIDNPQAENFNPPFKKVTDGDDDYDFLVYPQETPNGSVLNPYFSIPINYQLIDYWNRVEDRLLKIRSCQNILGISQPLPLFEPPIDPMALVQAIGSGASLSSAVSSLNIAVPHYRFSFMLRKAQDLVFKVSQLGNELLSTLEKKDVEELSRLQNRHESIILNMRRSITDAQLKEAQATTASLIESEREAKNRSAHYQKLINTGLLPTEIIQISTMSAAAVSHGVSAGFKIAASFGNAAPDVLAGPFITGVKYGGSNVGATLSSIAEVAESIGESLAMVGEIFGIGANYQRMTQDWELQRQIAESDIKQLEQQIEGAKLQEKIAEQEIKILEQEIEHHESVKTFMTEKFTNAELYQWLANKISGIYYQSYQMAYDYAKAAEKAFQYERGLPEIEVNFINRTYWDSQKKGLLAGDTLELDLDRLEKAYIESDSRGFEISKNISLIELDPVAFLSLINKGVCEFAFTEAFFDYDFPGHYCRQIKTISLSFDIGEGQTVMATLTQLNHKTVLKPDSKAVKFLLDPKDQPPQTIRNNWIANQQIALSHVDKFEKNNGLFELRFDNERYLPFEGTGAISNWRLELNGKKGSYNVNDLLNITINLKYTAEQGGSDFAKTVKGMLKPYPTTRFFDVFFDFSDQWNAFLQNDTNQLTLSLSRDLFPNMGSSRIFGIYAKLDLNEPGEISILLDSQEALALRDSQYLMTPNLTISNRGTDLVLTVNGDKNNLRNINLVLEYQATVT